MQGQGGDRGRMLCANRQLFEPARLDVHREVVCIAADLAQARPTALSF